ncbi:hypothetical protein [Atopococcus tabaci]|uniref:hypothetical protein n=1 Tax=Atopococcus tabaci TaxID=269774 RepID=UPI002409415F|nr:hypothetical protein [Atopococcus tabaci]
MNEITGTEVKYLLARIHGDSGKEEVANYNEYNATFTYMTDIGRATHFDDLKKVQDLANLQSMLAQLMGSGHQFKVIKQEINRTVVEEQA